MLYSLKLKLYSVDVLLSRSTRQLHSPFHSRFSYRSSSVDGGAREDRTPDLLRARQALSQLSYGPNKFRLKAKDQIQTRKTKGYCLSYCAVRFFLAFMRWWVWEELNLRPHPYQGCALTT